MKRVIFSIFLSFSLKAAIPIRVGLATEAFEYVISLEDGGNVCSKQGKVLLKLAPLEKVRFWWDGKGKLEALEEYRVQVGPPLGLKAAEALKARLKGINAEAELISVPDGNTWRLLLGRYPRSEDAAALLSKLRGMGHEELWVSTEKRLRAMPGGGTSLFAINERYEKQPLPGDGVVIKPDGGCLVWAGKGRYRGEMEIFPNRQGRLSLVNSVELETYLRGVVPKEMGAWEFPAIEALKAQAVAARTYAYVNIGKRAAEGFDLLDTVADQVYGGKDGEQNLTDRAILETKGLIAIHDGKPIQALFMANGGGATTDNLYVFGGNTPYLRAASSYFASPTTLTFRGLAVPKGEPASLSLDLLRLAAWEILPYEWLCREKLEQALKAEAIQPLVLALARRLNLPSLVAKPVRGNELLLWMGRALGFAQVAYGQERVQDYQYFLGNLPMAQEDKALATFLARKGLVPLPFWKNARLTLGQGLQVLGRLWHELEPLDFMEGTLLKDGLVRVKKGGPEPLKLDPRPILVEELPGGFLQLASEINVQVGDRLKWFTQEKGSRLLLRRLDPDGASMDRYNHLAHWKQEIKESDLVERLKQRVGSDAIQSLEMKQNTGGRVLELLVKDGQGSVHRFTGMRIRHLMGVKDNVFGLITLGKAPNRRFMAYGRGWGHGVGMDQTGAYGFALEGWSFEQILSHYYKGITLKSVEP